MQELIDTLWNVNKMRIQTNINATRELIDTLWNVNETSGEIIVSSDFGINRYIMECKF